MTASVERPIYSVAISGELAAEYGEWTSIRDLPQDLWFKVVPQDDGSADVRFAHGERPGDD